MPLSDHQLEEEAAFLYDETKLPNSHKRHANREHDRRLWFFTGVNLLIFVVFSTLNYTIWPRSMPLGWSTELADARRAIEYEERTFTGALVYDAQKGRAVRLQDADVEYFGRPSPSIDSAWADLLHNEYPSLTNEEASAFGDELKPLRRTGERHFEPDMFHSLHCLNGIRMKLVPVLYNLTAPMDVHSAHHMIAELTHDPLFEATHLEHCLDRLRQVILCHGDLTPSPLYTYDGFPAALGKTGVRTCRKYEPIRQWVDERARQGKVIQRG